MKIAICDDDAAFCGSLENMLQKYFAASEINADIHIFTSGESFLSAFHKVHFDLIFLDIELTGLDGIGVGQLIRRVAQDVQIVYVSAKSEYAMQLFQNRPFDFLVKPITEPKICTVLNEYFHVFSTQARYFSCVVERRKMQIAVSEILYFESLRNRLRVVTGEREMMVYTKLSDVLAEQFAREFLRIHQSFLVNLRHIVRFQFTEISLTNGAVLPVSRTYRNEVRSQLMQRGEAHALREGSL